LGASSQGLHLIRLLFAMSRDIIRFLFACVTSLPLPVQKAYAALETCESSERTQIPHVAILNRDRLEQTPWPKSES